jgi:hypothetical protein
VSGDSRLTDRREEWFAAIRFRCGDILVEDSSLVAVERMEMLNEERCFSSGGARDGSLGQAGFGAQPQVMCTS